MFSKSYTTKLKGVKVLTPVIYDDERGYFFESYNEYKIEEHIPNVNFVQDNESYSKKNVVRGFHYQIGDDCQSKLVRVIKGEIKDIIIDLRIDSNTYLESFEITLSDENKKQLFVPKGFAHGFSVLSEDAIVNYKTDNYYNKESERCINPLSKDLWVDWGINKENIIISQKDSEGLDITDFEDFKKNFELNNLDFPCVSQNK